MSPASAQTTNEVTNGGTISSGTTAIITNPVTSITGAITNDGSLEFWQSTTLNNSLVISGVGSVSQKGSGTTILSGANTYSGNTTVSAGRLSVGSSSALGTGTLTMNGGSLGVAGAGGWTLTNAIVLSANSVADTAGGNLTLGGTISGTGSFNKGFNNNTLTIAGTYAATGDLYTDQGTINFTGTQTGGGKVDATGNGIFNNTGTLNITNSFKQFAVGGWGSSSSMAVFNNNGTLYQASGSSFNIGKAGSGTFNQNGGTVTVANTALLSIGLEGNAAVGSGSGILNLNAGTFTVTSAVPFIYLGGTGPNTTNSTGVINLNGGTFATATRISKWAGTNSGTGNSATVNFNGGTLQGTANNMTLLGTDLTAVNILTNGATVDVGSGLTATISANLLDGGGNGGLTKTSAGTLILSGANTYTGGTTNSAGSLSVGSSSALGTGTLTLNGGSLGVAGAGGWTLTNAIVLSSNSVADTAGGNLTLGGTISGTGSFNKGFNNNTLTLAGTYAATGDLYTDQGTINFTGTQTGGGKVDATGNGIFNNTGTLNITNSFKQFAVGGWGSSSSMAVFNNNGTLYQASGSSFNIGKAGSGTFNQNGGTVTVANTALLSIGLEGNAAVGSGSGILNLNAGTFTVTSAVPFIYLGGTGPNTTNSTGVINLNGGTFATATRISKWAGTNSGTGNSATVNFNGGTLQGTANNMTLLGTDLTAVNILTNGATVDVGSGLTATISANLLDGGGNGGLTKTSAGTLILSGANTYTGGTTNSAGRLSVGSSSALGTGTLTMNGGSLGVAGAGGWTLTNAIVLSANSVADTSGGNLTLGGTISGTGSFNKGLNNNTLTLAGTYAATGDLYTDQGTINFTGTQTGGGKVDATGNGIFNNTGTLNITNSFKQFAVGGWGGNGTMAVFNNNGTLYQASGSSFNIGKAGSGTFNQNGGTVTVANTALLSIGLEGNAAVGSGSGILNLNAGTFTVTSAVPFIYLGGTGPNTTNSTGVINLNGGTFATATRISKWAGTNSGTGNSATVNFNGGTLQGTANNMTLLGTDLTAVNILTNGATVDVGSGLTATISANLLDGGGNGGLTKTGAGTLVLSGANTYTGATTVSGGTLTVNNNGSDTFSDTTTIQISSGAVLNLPNDVTDIVGTLVLGGQTYTSGLFDSSTPGGYITGSGKIQVGATVVAGYSDWASQNAPTGTATDDYDNDGVANGLEYVLGGSKDTQDANKNPQCSVSGGVMTFTFVRDQASIDGTTQVAIEVGTNLGTWPSVYTVGTDDAGSSAGVSVTKDSPATGKDTVSLSVSGSDSKKFARLRVITN